MKYVSGVKYTKAKNYRAKTDWKPPRKFSFRFKWIQCLKESAVEF